MPKINVYLPDELAEAVRDAKLPVSAICQAALERAVRDVASARATDAAPPAEQPGFGVFGRFTPRARRALTLAIDRARAVPNDEVGTAHLLLGVLDEGENLALRVLAALEVETEDLRTELVASIQPSASPPAGRAPFAPEATRALEQTAKEALTLGHNYVGCEHLLLGLLATEDGLASQVLRRMGLELRITRRTVVATLTGVVHAQVGPVTDRPDDPVLEQILRRLDAIEQRLAS